jgi:hypothetical protein
MKYTLLFAQFLIILFLHNPAQAQSFNWQKNFSIGISGGVSSFYGDLSVYDRQPLKKIINESDVAIGISIGHQLSSVLSLNLSYVDGKLKGKNDELKHYFNSDYSEASIASHISISRLMFPQRIGRVELYSTTGIGLLLFHSIERQILDNSSTIEQESNIANEIKMNTPVLKLGMGFNYEVSNRLNLSSEIAFRVTGNDMIDAHEGSTGIKDYYSVVSIGLTYVLNRIRSYSDYSLPCGANTKSYKTKSSRIHQACIPFN